MFHVRSAASVAEVATRECSHTAGYCFSEVDRYAHLGLEVFVGRTDRSL